MGKDVNQIRLCRISKTETLHFEKTFFLNKARIQDINFVFSFVLIFQLFFEKISISDYKNKIWTGNIRKKLGKVKVSLEG